jgi:hypothetical protein
MPLPEIVRVPLDPTVAEAVRATAHAELRDPPRQTAWLVAEALRARGVLPSEVKTVDSGDDDPPAPQTA